MIEQITDLAKAPRGRAPLGAAEHRTGTGRGRLRPLQHIAYGGGDLANNPAFSLSISFLAVY